MNMGQLLFALRCYKGMQRGAKGEKEGGTLLTGLLSV